MPTPPLTTEVLLEAVEAYRAAGERSSAAANSLGLHEATFRSRIKMAAARGLLGTSPVLPGFEIKEVTTRKSHGKTIGETIRQGIERPVAPFEPPPGHKIVFGTYQRDAEGNVIQDWVRLRPDDQSLEDVIAVVKASLEGFTAAAVPKPPLVASDKFLTLIPCADWHINMLAWGAETGESWDLKIAENVISERMYDVLVRSPESKIGVVLVGGDLMHADNNDNRTERSGHPLDADSRHEKGLQVAMRVLVFTIDTALDKNEHVIVRVLKGNHDPYSSVTVAYYLAAYYRNEPRVTVDLDPSLFWFYRFGNVLLGATHGHTVKLEKMPGIMSHRRREDWGAVRYCYAHGFHIHHKTKHVTEGEGVVCESHQAPIPSDAYHHGSGYLSGRSLQTITYHRETGEYSRVRAAIPDRVS